MNPRILALLAVLGAGGYYLMTRPYGALRGIVRLTSGKPAVGLTFWRTSGDADSSWANSIGSFDFVTFKITNGTKVLSDRQYAPVIAAANAAGTPIHTWSYNNLRTESEAANEGRIAAEVATRLGAKAHWTNAEHQWAGGYMGQQGAADPYGSMVAFVNAFRTTAPTIRLIFNSTTSWISPRLNAETDRRIAALFDAYGPMIYSSGSTGGIGTMKKKWMRGKTIADEIGIPFVPMLGSGRQDTNGQFWTNLPELAALQAEAPADWLTFWLAPGYLDRIYTANSLNPSLADFSESYG